MTLFTWAIAEVAVSFVPFPSRISDPESCSVGIEDHMREGSHHTVPMTQIWVTQPDRSHPSLHI